MSLVLLRVLSLFERISEEELPCVLFGPHSIIVGGLISGLAYPFLLVCTMVGTLWYAEIMETTVCVLNTQQGYYFLFWLAYFYVWLISYTIGIIATGIVNIRQRHYEHDY